MSCEEDHGNLPSLLWGGHSLLPAESLPSDSQSFPPIIGDIQPIGGDTNIPLPALWGIKKAD